MLFLDLDDFKPINDRLGHQAGDAVLVELASRLRRCVRASDTVARLGGDDCAVLIEEIDSPEVAAATIERILGDLRSPIIFDGTALSVSASVGMAVGSAAGRGGDELLRRADMAMYQAKRTRRSRSDHWPTLPHTRAHPVRSHLPLGHLISEATLAATGGGRTVAFVGPRGVVRSEAWRRSPGHGSSAPRRCRGSRRSSLRCRSPRSGPGAGLRAPASRWR